MIASTVISCQSEPHVRRVRNNCGHIRHKIKENTSTDTKEEKQSKNYKLQNSENQVVESDTAKIVCYIYVCKTKNMRRDRYYL